MPQLIVTVIEKIKEGATKESAHKAWAHVASVAKATPGLRRFQSGAADDGSFIITEVADTAAAYAKFVSGVNVPLIMASIEFLETRLQCTKAQAEELKDLIAAFKFKVFLTDGCPGYDCTVSDSKDADDLKADMAKRIGESTDDFAAMWKAKDPSALDGLWAKWYSDDDVLFIRPSGNPLTKAVWKGMVGSKDISNNSSEFLGIESCRSLANGDVVVVTYKQREKFNYKGTENDDIAMYTAVMERQPDGSYKMAHGHRATGQKPPAAK